MHSCISSCFILLCTCFLESTTSPQKDLNLSSCTVPVTRCAQHKGKSSSLPWSWYMAQSSWLCRALLFLILCQDWIFGIWNSHFPFFPEVIWFLRHEKILMTIICWKLRNSDCIRNRRRQRTGKKERSWASPCKLDREIIRCCHNSPSFPEASTSYHTPFPQNRSPKPSFPQ